MRYSREALWLWTAEVFGISNKRLWEMSGNYDDIDEFLLALRDHEITGITENEYKKADELPFEWAEEVLDNCTKKGIKYSSYESEDYPHKLKMIANPPAVLFYRGSLDFFKDKCIITVVGTRHPSEYSLKITDKICKQLIGRDILTASGFAVGIDQRVNSVSLNMGSNPIAVCGTPLDQDYPRGCDDFKDQIAQNGVIMSEYYPGYKIKSGSFAARNRISVGVSEGVLFVEAAKGSHGLENYDNAVSQGKPVFVIPPHDIYDSRYFGQRDLIRNECQPVFGVSDIVYTLVNGGCYNFKYVERLGEYNIPSEDSTFFKEEDSTKKRRKRVKKKDEKREDISAEEVEDAKQEVKSRLVDYSQLTEVQQKICRLLEQGDILADEISIKLEMDASDVINELTELEMDGIVKSLPGKKFGI